MDPLLPLYVAIACCAGLAVLLAGGTLVVSFVKKYVKK